MIKVVVISVLNWLFSCVLELADRQSPFLLTNVNVFNYILQNFALTHQTMINFIYIGIATCVDFIEILRWSKNFNYRWQVRHKLWQQGVIGSIPSGLFANIPFLTARCSQWKWVSECIGVLRHMQRYLSHICDGTECASGLKKKLKLKKGLLLRCPREDVWGLSREYVLRIPSVS